MSEEKMYLHTKPIERLRETSGNDLNDVIDGILVGFADVLRQRNGHIDLITLHDSRNEIKELIMKQGGEIE